MQAALLDEIIIIESLRKEKDEYGAEKTLYLFKTKTRANVKRNGGGKTLEATSEIVFTSNVTFKVRIYHKIENTDRICWKGQYYMILDIDENKREQSKTITATLMPNE